MWPMTMRGVPDVTMLLSVRSALPVSGRYALRGSSTGSSLIYNSIDRIGECVQIVRILLKRF